ncbi:methyl-accepting chemotaxis protein [Paenibacillus sp. PL2-23]|uniref:methyl-accepting chemotaxis protein n=1 Tax=Paenibacillus sp. PL2-23 TaxID=2100729 RepID=UPI0030FA91F1
MDSLEMVSRHMGQEDMGQADIIEEVESKEANEEAEANESESLESNDAVWPEPDNRIVMLLDYARTVPTVTSDLTCSELLTVIGNNRSECVVVCDKEGRPEGLLMRNRIYAKLQGRFSAELYYDKSIMKIADTSPLIAAWDMAPQKIIDLALSRDEETLYDCVLVTKHGKLAGVLAVSDLLKLSRMLQERAVVEQRRTILSAERRVKEIEEIVRQTRHSAGQGETLSMDMVDLTLSGKNELDKVKRAFHSFAEYASQQEQRMTDLQKEAGFISSFSKLIKELAEQSNLLAINASIEAARAGEYGRGFSVVASEVMNLANQTKKSAGEITALTERIVRAIQETAALAQEGQAVTASSEAYMNETENVFNLLFKSAAENRSSAKSIDGLSEQAHLRAVEVTGEMESLRQNL